MRLALLIRSLGVGGAERQLELLAKGLNARGHDVTLLTFYEGGERAARLAAEGIKVRSLEKSGRWDMAGFLLRLLRELKVANPDVLYSFLSVSNLFAGLLKPLLRCRTVWSIRASALNMQSYDRLTAVSAWVEARLSPFADLVISNSEAGRRDAIASGFPVSKTIVIPNGIDTQQFHPNDAARRRFRETQKLDERTIAVGMVARMDPMKGHVVFLQAASLLAERNPDLKFFCIGGGNDTYRNKLMAHSAALTLQRKLTWLPTTEDVLAAYNGLDILCSASIFGEGFPNVIGEAMSCGRVCVATDIGDSAAIIGDQSRIVTPGDHVGLATAIESGMRVRHSNVTARARIVENFSVECMVTRTEAALAENAYDT